MRNTEEINASEMENMRWRLWYAFRDSRYEKFKTSYKTKYGIIFINPHFENIKAYCRKYWKKEPKDMTKEELAKYIGTVKRKMK